MADMIFDQPGVPTLAYDGDPANLSVTYVLTNSNGTLPSQPDIVVGRPTYVNQAAGDYHFIPASLGVDFAPAAGGADLDRVPHGVDLPRFPTPTANATSARTKSSAYSPAASPIRSSATDSRWSGARVGSNETAGAGAP
jgi:hypothetical protein